MYKKIDVPDQRGDVGGYLGRHYEEDEEFTIEFPGERAQVSYFTDEDTVYFTHTFTPEDLRGLQIATSLVAVAVAWARENGYRIVAYCPFVRHYLDTKDVKA